MGCCLTGSPRGISYTIPLRRGVTTSAFSSSERSRLRLQAAVSLAYLSAIDAYAQVTAPHFVLLALTIQVITSLCLTLLSTLTHPAGRLFPCPFPVLNEDHPSLAYTGVTFPVQHYPFLDSIRSRRRNKEYCKDPLHSFSVGLTVWSGERIYYGDAPETWAS